MALTFGTVSRRLHSIITVMALERAIPEMIRECHAAIRAFEGMAAFRTEDKVSKPSSIEKE
jgi:hypothetical protein